jgi:hypothetical protein
MSRQPEEETTVSLIFNYSMLLSVMRLPFSFDQIACVNQEMYRRSNRPTIHNRMTDSYYRE